MIRLLLVIVFLLFYFIFLLPLLLLQWIIGKKNPMAAARLSKAIVGWGFRSIKWLSGVKLIVEGTENIPTDTSVLYVGNHRSYFDVVLTLSLFPNVTGYVAKKEIKKVPILRRWMNAIHCIFLDRDNIKEGLKTILQGVEELKKGYSLCIFPEGTRNKETDTLLPFHEGSFKLAEKSGVPIVPMTLVNTAAIFEDHFPLIKRSTVVIQFGEPIYISELDREGKKALATNVSNQILSTYLKNKNLYGL